MQTQKFDITGMSCAACAAAIEKTVGKLTGVQKAEVNLLANSMVATYDPTIVMTEEIVQAVEKLGYGAAPIAPQGTATATTQSVNHAPSALQREMHSMKVRLLVSFSFLVPLLYISMGHMFGAPLPAYLTGTSNAMSFALTQFFLTLPVVLVNSKYFTGGFKSLAHAAPNMDSLIALGSGAAILYGIFALYRIGWGLGHGQSEVVTHYLHELYFESAATILALITLGKTLEAISKGRTGAALSALLDLAPKTALLLQDDNETEVPIEQIQPGDVLAVRPGARVPVDGVVLQGASAVDESAITGESLPVDKEPGAKVISATINTNGYFTMRAERVGDDTTLAQITHLVEEAGASKAPIAKLADKVSGIFVPIVIGIALVCFAAWMIAGQGIEFALSRAITVLVISCPCALGLATPVAIMVGTGKGAKYGILYSSAEALETLCHVDTVVLDKTGTLTEGKPRLTDLVSFEGSEEDLLRLAAGLEAKSEHPVGRAILEEAQARNIVPLPAENFTALSGFGLLAHVEGSVCCAGNDRLMAQQNIDISPAAALAQQWAAKGKTPLYFSRNGRLAGLIAVADLPKKSSAAAVAAFHSYGLCVVMLTGDNAATAQTVGYRVGVDEAIADVLPQDKEQKVRSLMEAGHKVAMIGDGINDAPALARADVGIAIGAGTDVAIESAGIVLMKSDLADAVAAYELSRRVLRNIKQNLFWAFFYNALCIPLAAGVFYPAFGLMLNPMFGAAAMSFSSVFVVCNALRLNWFKPKSLPSAPMSNLEISPTSKALLSASTQKIARKENNILEKTITIEGMSCGHCSARVEAALKNVTGVTNATVSLDEKLARVETDGRTSEDALRAAVTDAGYEVVSIE